MTLLNLSTGQRAFFRRPISFSVGYAWNSPSIMNMAAVMARALAFLVPVPFLFTYFSSAEVALWFVFTTFQSMLALFYGTLPSIYIRILAFARTGASELGTIFETTGKAPSQTEAVPNWPLINEITANLRAVMGLLTVIWLVAAASLGTAIIWTPAEKAGGTPDAYWAWAFFVLGAAVRLYSQVYVAFLIGLDKIVLVKRLETLSWFASGVLVFFAMSATKSLAISMLIFQAPLIAYVVALHYYAAKNGQAKRTDSWTKILSSKVGTSVLPRAGKAWIGIFASLASVYGTGLIFAQIGEAKITAAYLLALNTIGIINQLSMAPFFSMVPKLSALRAEGNLREQTKIGTESMLLSLCVFALGIGGVGVVVPILLKLASPDAQFVPVTLWAAMAAANFAFRYGALHLHYYTTTNDIKWHIVDTVNAGLLLLLLWLLFPLWGIYAFPAAQLIALCMFYIPYSRALTATTLSFEWPQRDAVTLVLPIILLGAAVLLSFLTADFLSGL